MVDLVLYPSDLPPSEPPAASPSTGLRPPPCIHPGCPFKSLQLVFFSNDGNPTRTWTVNLYLLSTHDTIVVLSQAPGRSCSRPHCRATVFSLSASPTLSNWVAFCSLEKCVNELNTNQWKADYLLHTNTQMRDITNCLKNQQYIEENKTSSDLL